ncbi:MAG: hypothetical protein WKF82_11145 [Nocardioidaceae bacterium]
MLGDVDGAYAAELFGVRQPGNFERGTSTLRLDRDPDDWERHHDVVRRLLQARSTRTRPARDDKVVAAWNGLVIAALAEAGVILDEPRYVEAAEAAGQLLVDIHLSDEGARLRRVSRDGVAGAPAGVLEDYACVAEGLLVLFGSTGERRWFDEAAVLVDQILARFGDGKGGYFDTADEAEVLFKRPQDPSDNASPSGQSVTATVLLTLFGITGDEAHLGSADTLLKTLSGLAERAPRFAGQILAASEAMLDGPRQVAVVGPDGDESRRQLVRAAYQLAAPGVVIAQGTPADAAADDAVPLLAHRTLVDGKAAAYVCHHFACDLPVTSPDQVR